MDANNANAVTGVPATAAAIDAGDPLTLAEVLNRFMAQVPAWSPPPPAPAPAPAPPAGLNPTPVIRFAQLADLPAPAWLVESILPENGLACVYAPPGSGKTFLAIDWSLRVATGRAWGGHATRPGGVLYVAAEGGSGLGPRVTAWETQFGPAPAANGFAVLNSINLLDEFAVPNLLAGLAAAGGTPRDLALIVVDTLARCMVGGDENSARDMGRAIASADALRAATGATVLLVHHTGKSGTVERGSSALRGACDVMVSLSADDGQVTVECDKMKEAAPFPLSRWSLEERGASCILLPSAEVALAHPHRALSPPQRKVLEALAGAVVGGSGPAAEIRAVTNLADTTLYRALQGLIDRGFVAVGAGLPKTYRLTDAGAQMA